MGYLINAIISLVIAIISNSIFVNKKLERYKYQLTLLENNYPSINDLYILIDMTTTEYISFKVHNYSAIYHNYVLIKDDFYKLRILLSKRIERNILMYLKLIDSYLGCIEKYNTIARKGDINKEDQIIKDLDKLAYQIEKTAGKVRNGLRI